MSSDQALRTLADEAGILTRWVDYRGEPHAVGIDTLRALLESLELPCRSPQQIAQARACVADEQLRHHWQPLVIATPGVDFRNGGVHPGPEHQRYRATAEDGTCIEGMAHRGDAGSMSFPGLDMPGYYRVEIGNRSFLLAVAPRHCFGLADTLGSKRAWGLTAQLYSLRRQGDGGIGDFTALAQFTQAAAKHGADAVAISPVHALFSGDVTRFSPYSPSSRLFLNALHVDPAQVFGAERVAVAIAATGLEATLMALECGELVDWPQAACARLQLLRHLYSTLDSNTTLSDSFRSYCAQAGSALIDHARFEALYAHFADATQVHHWREWPTAYRDHEGPAVAAFAQAHAEEVRFHAYLQWLAESGLHAAQDAARRAGMGIGLIGDLAVGTDGGGSHAWSRPHDLLLGISVGAPPDLINALGQSWGLTTFSPRALRRHGYAPFLEMLRAQLRHIGGLRVDHVIGLNRLWLVPEGADARQGAYLRYPLDELFRLTALESWRNRAILIGEDLGTVPDGFRDQLATAGILGMRVLWFERDWGLFVDPLRWPPTAVAMTSTHDLPTVAGWWQERDIDWRARLNLFGPHANEADERATRSEDRIKLWAAYQFAGIADGEVPSRDAPQRAVDCACAFVARTPSPLTLLPIEDALGLDEQPNIPGTVDQHPNWRRRLPQTADQLLDAPEAAARLASVQAARLQSTTA